MSAKNAKDTDGLFTDRDSFQPHVSAIPLSDVDTHAPGEASIGDLVRDATSQFSTLVRSEVELAKAEMAESGKKAGMAAGFFGAAGVILAYSSFFLFFTIAEVLDTWLWRWAAFLIVFLLMLVLVAILALVGLKKVKGVKKPEKTISTVTQIPEVLPSGLGEKAEERKERSPRDAGLYT